MKRRMFARNRFVVLFFALALLGLTAFLYFKPAAKAVSEMAIITEQSPAGLENYDIRTDKNSASALADFRVHAGQKEASLVATKQRMNTGENALRNRVPTLKVEYNANGAPEIIAPDVMRSAAFLTSAGTGKRSEILRRFLKENSELVGLYHPQIDGLKITADYTNPDGNLSFAQLEQVINGVPVFQGEVKAGFTKQGEIIRVINYLAAGLESDNLSQDFGLPENAVLAAARHTNREATAAEIKQISGDNLKVTFERGQFAGETTAEKIYFPIETGVARPAWRVLLWENPSAFYVVVDAETGTLLWRKNITEFQTQTATYNVYGNTTSPMKTHDSPAPFTSGPSSPNGQQGAIVPRTNFTLIGNEPPYTFNTNGWIPDGVNETDGNNVEAGIDRDGVNGVDPNGKAYGNPTRVFNFTYNPAPGNPPPGEEPLPPGTQPYPPTPYQQGSITHVFYAANRYHDETYLLGFTETARNFQQDNFGRGGTGNDRLSVEIQDSSATNSANFSTPADGGRGRAQFFVWTGPTPDRDGALDAQIVIHELTHGLSNRLHGNATGLSTNMSRAMGEGWSDFYAISLLSEPTDNPLGIHAVGGYVTYEISTGFTNNYYYGIRRFPYAVIASVGPNGRPHSPLTFRHLNSNCNTEIGTPTTIGTISAYPRGPIGVTQCDQVHNGGEIWGAALWEVRGQLVNSNGGTVGNRKALQFVTDGMKLSPLGPTMLQARDAILVAAQASGSAQDVRDIWRGFALRGLGFGAQIISASPANVVESFEVLNLLQTPQFTFTDAAPGGNGNGFPEQGETIQLTIPLTNQTGNTATNTTLQVVDGGNANYGDIANGQTVTRTVGYTIPVNACGNRTLTFNVNSSLGTISFTRTITVGTPIVALTQNFDGVTAPALPTGWTQATVGSNTGWVTATGTADSPPNSAFTPNPVTAGGADLESPTFNVTSLDQRVRFRNNYNTESTWDGGVLEIKIGAGAFQDIITAGGTFIEGGYNGTCRGTGNPLPNRQCWTGNSNGYINTTIQLPNSAVGQTVQLRFRMGHDNSVAGTGWNIDSLQVVSLICGDPPLNQARADFDGDGKTDISVVRGGNWYVQRSTAGFVAASWGVSTDTVLGGDFDGDGKADYAVFRPNASGGAVLYVLRSSNGLFQSFNWGLPSDIPVVQDYDGDGRDDITVYRPVNQLTNSTWYVLRSSGGSIQAVTAQTNALNTDKPVIGDFDGDGRGDFTLYRDGTWFVQKSNGGAVETVQWGLSEDKAVTADYDGDLKTDIAVFRPSNGTWYIRKSSGGTLISQFGIGTDVPVPGDYDGDGKDDIAVFRDGSWYRINSSNGQVASFSFGITGDKPVPNAYLP